MNSYDKALYKVVDQMLTAKDCGLEDGFMRHTLVELLRNKIREIGTRTSNGSNHAGRPVPSFFDLERTFGQMGITAADLRAMIRSQGRIQHPVQCPKPETRDEDFHKGPEPMLTETNTRELAGCSHIPDNFPPFPGAHSYKSTLIKKRTEKSYEEVRQCHAENQLSAQRALNGFFLGCEPNLSLTGSTLTKEDSFKVLVLDPRQKVACVDALMPRSEVFEKDIYEAKDEITHAGTYRF
ncbi:hypothetical protein KR059_004854 [Drosophila kikkawai]|nr:hypothetical protein KR059_004854 [Drosophila kikkawai]